MNKKDIVLFNNGCLVHIFTGGAYYFTIKCIYTYMNSSVYSPCLLSYPHPWAWTEMRPVVSIINIVCHYNLV